jgi:hypothetical protein
LAVPQGMKRDAVGRMGKAVLGYLVCEPLGSHSMVHWPTLSQLPHRRRCALETP